MIDDVEISEVREISIHVKAKKRRRCVERGRARAIRSAIMADMRRGHSLRRAARREPAAPAVGGPPK